MAGVQNIEIAFRKPEVLGITQEQMEHSSLSTFEIATCIERDKNFPINVFFHAIREVPGGIEYRSRYWLKYTIKNDKPVCSKLPIPNKKLMYYMARSNCIHSLTEYNNLASILPSIYAEYEGKIE